MSKTAKVENVAAVQENLPGVAALPKFKVVKHVTMPTFKLANDIPLFVTIDDKIFTGKKLKGEDKKEPAKIVNVTNLTTGEVGQIVLGTVLLSNLMETYPNDGYVGKSFQITKHSKVAGKEYNNYTILEIEIE